MSGFKNQAVAKQAALRSWKERSKRIIEFYRVPKRLAKLLRKDGATLKEIAEIFNADGLRTSRGCLWDATAVWRLLK